jgi:hypothetical protein
LSGLPGKRSFLKIAVFQLSIFWVIADYAEFEQAKDAGCRQKKAPACFAAPRKCRLVPNAVGSCESKSGRRLSDFIY